MENETDTKAPRTDEGDTLSTTLNSTNKKRTLNNKTTNKKVEERVWKEAKKNKTKGALRNTKRNRTTKNSVEEGLKRLKRLSKQMKEPNYVLSRTEPLGRGPRGQGCDTDKWRLCKAGRFSYGDSPRTPPLEGTSLHRWNKSVERAGGILSLFTTCLRLR